MRKLPNPGLLRPRRLGVYQLYLDIHPHHYLFLEFCPQYVVINYLEPLYYI